MHQQAVRIIQYSLTSLTLTPLAEPVMAVFLPVLLSRCWELAQSGCTPFSTVTKCGPLQQGHEPPSLLRFKTIRGCLLWFTRTCVILALPAFHWEFLVAGKNYHQDVNHQLSLSYCLNSFSKYAFHFCIFSAWGVIHALECRSRQTKTAQAQSNLEAIMKHSEHTSTTRCEIVYSITCDVKL